MVILILGKARKGGKFAILGGTPSSYPSPGLKSILGPFTGVLGGIGGQG